MTFSLLIQQLKNEILGLSPDVVVCEFFISDTLTATCYAKTFDQRIYHIEGWQDMRSHNAIRNRFGYSLSNCSSLELSVVLTNVSTCEVKECRLIAALTYFVIDKK